jgi:2,4-dienoyl-CoA reductase (NADPH2)
VPAGRLPVDESKHAMAAMFYEGRRAQMNFFFMQFAPFRRLFEWNWGRRMPFRRGRTLLPEKIEGMNEQDAAAVKAASGLPVFCVGGWQTASRMREALQAGRCDVITIARGLLANPDMVRQFEAGRDAPARPCTYCNKCLVNALLQPLACWEESRFDSRDAMFEQAYQVYKESAVGVRREAAAAL